MSYVLSIIGLMLLLAGLVYGAMILNIPMPWIIVGTLVVLGLGVIGAAKAPRQRDVV